MFHQVFGHCCSRSSDIRLCTTEKNLPMMKVLKSHYFTPVGRFDRADGIDTKIRKEYDLENRLGPPRQPRALPPSILHGLTVPLILYINIRILPPSLIHNPIVQIIVICSLDSRTNLLAIKSEHPLIVRNLLVIYDALASKLCGSSYRTSVQIGRAHV